MECEYSLSMFLPHVYISHYTCKKMYGIDTGSVALWVLQTV